MPKGAELIFEKGRLYHIDLKQADNIPPNILLVGADSRVDEIATQLNSVQFRHRSPRRSEFYTVCGTYRGIKVAVMSCGIGPDNMAIAINELHALFEYNHKTKEWSATPAPLKIIRVGTSGSCLPEVPLGTIVISQFSVGIDNLGSYYPRPDAYAKKNSTVYAVAKTLEKAFLNTVIGRVNPLSYVSISSPRMWQTLEEVSRIHKDTPGMILSGTTNASPDFFGAEGRSIGRIKTAFSQEEFIRTIQQFDVGGFKILNHEMETSILFRLANEKLNYLAGAICIVIDNLALDDVIEKTFAKKRMKKCIRIALDTMIQLNIPRT